MPELYDLYAARKRLFFEEQYLVAAGPGRYVAWFENLTIDLLGPRRYADLLMPIYQEAVPIHAAAGKRVMVDYDGALRAVALEISEDPRRNWEQSVPVVLGTLEKLDSTRCQSTEDRSSI